MNVFDNFAFDKLSIDQQVEAARILRVLAEAGCPRSVNIAMALATIAAEMYRIVTDPVALAEAYAKAGLTDDETKH